MSRSPVHWMMERATNGDILDTSATVDASGQTVLDVLKGKHPEPKDAAEKAFLHCDELPSMADVDGQLHTLRRLLGKSRGGRAW